MDTCKICGSKNVINYKHPRFNIFFMNVQIVKSFIKMRKIELV